MGIRGTTFGVIQIATAVIVGIVGLVLLSACGPTVPPKLLPAYTINISFPSHLSKVTLNQGGSISLPVTVTSQADQPMNIRLLMVDNDDQLPQFLQYNAQEEFVALPARGSFNSLITINAANEAPLGDYDVGIRGQLEEPVKERSMLTHMFRLTILAAP